MSSFSRVLLSWQPFYTTIASASATLVGLLFVSLTFNPDRFDSAALSTARRSFANLLDVLLIALIFLIPHGQSLSLALTLLTFSLARSLAVLRQLTKKGRKNSTKKNPKVALNEEQRSLFSSFGMAVLSGAILKAGIHAMFLPVIVIFMMIASAGVNAWELLLKD